MSVRETILMAGASALFLSGAGCVTDVPYPNGRPVTVYGADDEGFVQGTGIESQDLVAVTDAMARAILNTPAIRDAANPPTVVLDPVINNTRFPINEEIFLRRIRALLNQRAAGRVYFLARNRMQTLENEREMKRDGRVLSSSDPRENQFLGADYFLTGALDGMSSSSRDGVSDYVMYSFQLIDAPSSLIIWEDFREIKKQALSDVVYR